MRTQVGDLRIGDDGLARRGLLVRHLVLPGHVTESVQVLRRLAESFGPTLAISLLAQYQPMHRAHDLPALDRRLRREEYERVCRVLVELGFEQGFVQSLDAPLSYLPDFGSRANPFEV
jgi:putative pyruvate formate lyase activating enzyme